ncbi:non-ribosomal peptide synthetase [Caldalkalibacillus mannanilyticus]|uniref:non-ribosomal peptide synthetase n=1 Tax=Caldalkalibacillus mannanilyticus TaxID=1418 RepID=UPI00046A26ED|nr:amino acid adenylation domain-containing protein [Caldalkalibacillus mannanilyticus]
MNKTKKVQNVYKLTPMQQGMLFHSLANPYSSAYFEQTSVDIEGVFHIDLFEQSINQLIERHDILRTVFSTSIREQILQIVWQHQPLPVQVEDLQTMSKEEQKTYIDTFKKEDRLKGFNLSRGPLMRIAVLQKGETSFHLVWSFHHILMDGWCVPLIYKEAFYIYQQLVENNTILLPEAPPYKRYIEWLEKQDQQQADDYWNAYLAGYEQQVSLIKSEQKMTEGYRSSKEGFELGAERTARLHALSKRYQVTLNTLLQTIWGVVLQRYNNCNDIVFGGVVSGRPAEIRGVEEMLGLFINTIPIRIMSKDNESFEQCVQRVQRDSLESAQYDFYPLYEIQARTALKQELVNHIMVFENYPVDQQIKEMSNNAQSPYSFHNVEVFEQTSYDLNLIIAPGNSLQIAFHYNELVYDQQTIEQIMGHLTSVMDQIISQPDLRIQELKLLTQPEIEQILYDFNKTEEAYPREKSIAELFEEQVRVTPHQEAVIFGEKALSYEELNRRANQLARKLCRNGVQPDTIVGILMDRSLEMIIGIMGVLKAGGAYLPLDPSYPTERIQYMLQDSGVDIVLSQHRITHLIDSLEFQGEVLLLDQFEYEGEEESNLEPQAGAEDLAYLIYTSGSTGQPKGVMIEHRGVVNLLQTQKKAFDLGPESRVLQFASFSFDASVWEIFMSLLTGASLYLEEQDRLLPGPSFIRLVREKRITTLTLPPAALALLPEEELPDLQTLIVAGEACSGDLARRWARGRRFFNAYGPTEGTVCASMALCTEELVGNPSIGRPILNKQILIVSENGHLQPIGVAGELCIAGEGLARGYLNKPDITKERFVTHPYDPQKQMYRTGI